MNLHFITHFLRHYIQSTPIDILHSPFVFKLYQQCIKRYPANKDAQNIEARRKLLWSDSTPIAYQDFGASGKSRNTKVSELANHHLKPARIAQILQRLAEHFPFETFLELGTSLGISTSYLAKGSAQGAIIHTIEACEPVRNKAMEVFKDLHTSKKIVSHLGTFDEVLPQLLPQIARLDFLFIDGNHSYEATLRYFEMCKPYLHQNSVVVFDDIYWSAGMTQAWNEIKNDPFVQVTVDLFFVGLVYFRTEQVRQNFKLRIF